MPLEPEFWKKKPLEELTAAEWEALCDGCGKCCLFKLIAPEEDKVRFTNVTCRYMDLETCRCTDYDHRHENVPECLIVTPKLAREANWLPKTCAYRLLAHGEELPWWHPLRSGNVKSVILAGQSVFGKVVSEEDVDLDDLEDMVVDWFE
ncbi:MAG TPA: YcgN family cysteine cluster protein [Anaerolineaceae bacterium]|nr:YcgN family cysteine cluster protein [Anaerolineaceae bacterium]